MPAMAPSRVIDDDAIALQHVRELRRLGVGVRVEASPRGAEVAIVPAPRLGAALSPLTDADYNLRAGDAEEDDADVPASKLKRGLHPLRSTGFYVGRGKTLVEALADALAIAAPQAAQHTVTHG
jgi:hypothetical protein